MSDTTIVAIVILGGVFLVMSMAIFKAGVEGAVKVWSVMGALTGVAFGSITSFYFTNESNQQEIRQAKLEKNTMVLALADVANKADEANKFFTSFAAELKNEKKSISAPEKSISAPGRDKIISSISEDERTQLIARIEHASKQLNEISKLQAQAVQSEAGAATQK
jgi:hypothetical protein